MSYCTVITCVNRFKLVSTTFFSMMSKLARALLVFGLFAVAWVVLAWDLPGLGLTSQWLQLVWAMPAYLLVCFGCWTLATVGLRLSSFRDCPEAAEELRAEVVAARMHLSTQGYRF